MGQLHSIACLNLKDNKFHENDLIAADLITPIIGLYLTTQKAIKLEDSGIKHSFIVEHKEEIVRF